MSYDEMQQLQWELVDSNVKLLSSNYWKVFQSENYDEIGNTTRIMNAHSVHSLCVFLYVWRVICLDAIVWYAIKWRNETKTTDANMDWKYHNKVSDRHRWYFISVFFFSLFAHFSLYSSDDEYNGDWLQRYQMVNRRKSLRKSTGTPWLSIGMLL